MATQVEVPALGESVTQAILVRWHKADGESVRIDEPLAELETDKANVDVPAPASGVVRHVKEEGETVAIGEVIARIDEGPAPAGKAAGATGKPAAAGAVPAEKAPGPLSVSTSSPAEAPAAQGAPPGGGATGDLSPAVRRLVEEHQLDPAAIPPSGPGGRLTKEDVLGYLEKQQGRDGRGGARAPEAVPPAAPLPTPPVTPAVSAGPAAASAPHAAAPKAVPVPAPATAAPTIPSPPPPASSAAATKPPAMDFDAQGVRRVPMSKIRKRIAERLVQAQQTAAILTTFNEIDLTAVLDLRSRYRERFNEVHGVSLGLMSFFVRGCVLALREFPHLNAFIEGDDIVYHNYVNMGIAVSTERGLAVPVLRHVETMSFARIEAEIKRVAAAVRDGKLSVEELSGGTFTITNGGVFGSLLSTPILNPPQSGILGMHAIQKRPVVIDDKIEGRPMMYVALSYDHRVVDGRESVSFLVRLKQFLEDPARLMLEI